MRNDGFFNLLPRKNILQSNNLDPNLVKIPSFGDNNERKIKSSRYFRLELINLPESWASEVFHFESYQ